MQACAPSCAQSHPLFLGQLEVEGPPEVTEVPSEAVCASNPIAVGMMFLDAKVTVSVRTAQYRTAQQISKLQCTVR